ncbi:MAG: hypothetical protein RLZZ241_901, partial [Bacteroidota bacterium]
MKPVLYLFFLLVGVSVFSQGNVFPPVGNVGIGTLNPNYTLDINGTIRANQIYLGGTTLVSSPWVNTEDQLSYSLGNVGIGVLNPAHTLDVVGTVNASNFLINGNPLPSSPWTLDSNTLYYNSGNIGIGTNSPASALDVA